MTARDRVRSGGRVGRCSLGDKRSGYAPRMKGDRVGSAPRGENPLVMTRMRSGFAVIGDMQLMPGYSVLLTDDPAVNHSTDLDRLRRSEFLFDMSLLGEAIETACRSEGLRRMNYSIYGNALAVLHAHVVPRYEWEPAEFREGGSPARPAARRSEGL